MWPNYRWSNYANQGRIQDSGFPVGGGANPPGGANIWFCQIFRKTTWNWENFGPLGGTGGRPLRSATANWLICAIMLPINIHSNVLRLKGNSSDYNWWLVRVTFVVAFGFLPQHFVRWQDPRIILLSFYECRFNGGDALRWWEHSNSTIYAKEFIWIYCTQRWWGRKNFGHEGSCLGPRLILTPTAST